MNLRSLLIQNLPGTERLPNPVTHEEILAAYDFDEKFTFEEDKLTPEQTKSLEVILRDILKYFKGGDNVAANVEKIFASRMLNSSRNGGVRFIPSTLFLNLPLPIVFERLEKIQKLMLADKRYAPSMVYVHSMIKQHCSDDVKKLYDLLGTGRVHRAILLDFLMRELPMHPAQIDTMRDILTCLIYIKEMRDSAIIAQTPASLEKPKFTTSIFSNSLL